MRALIAMSGGVDSSVSAYRMQQVGYECVGCTMRLYENDMIGEDLMGTCCSMKDTEDARAVTKRLGMDYHIFHYEQLFQKEVIESFVTSYEMGETPNPCIECNRCFKFHHLFDKMEKLGCDCIVTGHYARIEYDRSVGRYLLKKGEDPAKDQSYVLYTMTQDQLAHTRFPIGDISKDEVRRIAEEMGFVNAHKHDSQDICFVPDGDYAAFMERYRKRTYPKGDFVDRQGNVLGRHKGYIRYTIGQRKGLGISAEHPWYVVAIDPRTNTVTLGEDRDLFQRELWADRINLISVEKIETPMRIKAKIRYRQTEQPAVAEQVGDRLKITFDEPQRAITKGQAVVMYQGEVVVGGGVIL